MTEFMRETNNRCGERIKLAWHVEGMEVMMRAPCLVKTWTKKRDTWMKDERKSVIDFCRGLDQ